MRWRPSLRCQSSRFLADDALEERHELLIALAACSRDYGLPQVKNDDAFFGSDLEHSLLVLARNLELSPKVRLCHRAIDNDIPDLLLEHGLDDRGRRDQQDLSIGRVVCR